MNHILNFRLEQARKAIVDVFDSNGSSSEVAKALEDIIHLASKLLDQVDYYEEDDEVPDEEMDEVCE